MSSFDVPLFLQQLRHAGCSLGEPLTYLQQTDSTNTQAKVAARAGGAHGSCFVADEQTAGRGRQGRHWHSDPAENLLFSILLKPTLPPQKLSPLTLVVGLGVRDALSRHTHAKLELKWPNDIVVGSPDLAGKSIKPKLAGILTESELTSDAAAGHPAVIVGVGINVLTRRFPDELRDIATSLKMLRKADAHEVSREELLVDLLRSIEGALARYEEHGLREIVPELIQHDALKGRQVRVDGKLGTAQGIDDQGQLLLKVDGQLEAIHSGTVEWS